MREHTAALVPPRALWVPFMLGRPFGVPNNATFQRRVLLAALRLLERETGPVLEDFPDEAPYDDLGAAPVDLVCPVSFPSMPSGGTLGERLAEEVARLQAWHEVAIHYRGRTTLGVTGLQPPEIAEFLASWLTGAPRPTFRDGIASGDALKLACDELKAYYYEAKSIQPGRHASAEIHDWFWMQTAAGQVLRAIRDQAAQSSDPSMKTLAMLTLIPRSVDLALQAARGGEPQPR